MTYCLLAQKIFKAESQEEIFLFDTFMFQLLLNIQALFRSITYHDYVALAGFEFQQIHYFIVLFL